MPRFSPTIKAFSPSCPGSAYVDLHVHSDASDGSFSVQELIEKAVEAGLGAVSFTDHDTVEGTCEALRDAPSLPLEILAGLELSAEHPSGGMHILGYLFKPEAPCLKKALSVLQDARTTRNLKMVKNLQGLGVDISYEEIKTIAVRGQVGRPHFAQALVKKGVTRTIEEAFHKFLGSGRPGYASKYRLSFSTAIETILEAGGVPVLAHPASLQVRRESELEKILIELKRVGLQGLEAYYPDHSPRQQAMYEQLAARHELAMSGGTDFHGETKPQIHLGVGKGDLRVPYRFVERLKELHNNMAPGRRGNAK